MSQRVALIISVALTAFVLVVAGAAAGRVSLKSPAADAAVDAPVVVEQGGSALAAESVTGDSAAELTPADREAQYQELIRQANERLQAAYEQLQAQQAAALQPDAALITPDQAAEIARQYVPDALIIRPPQLFDYQDKLAYDVTMDLGPLYIDAYTGEILYDGTIVPGGILAGGPGNRGASASRLGDDSRSSEDNRGGDDRGEEDHGGEDHSAEGGDD